MYGDTGSWEAVSVAEKLLSRGSAAHLVSRLDAPGAAPPFPPATVPAARERFLSGRVAFTGVAYLREITGDQVSFEHRVTA